MKILVISPSWIGDTVISHSMYQLLMKKYCSNINIDVLTSIWCKDLFSHMPEISQTLFIPYRHGSLELSKCYHLGKFLKNEQYQQAIILPNSFKSALIPFFAGIPVRTGWRGEMRYGILNDLRILNKTSFPLMVQRYAALACDYNVATHFCNLPDPLPLPRLSVSDKQIENVLCKFNLYFYRKSLIGLCPGAEFGLAKSWPHYHYITLAVRLIRDGYHVVILGSPKDQLINRFIKHSILNNLKQHCNNLIGITSLGEAIAIIATCIGIVSNDSGLMHIACALKRPVIGLYGPSNPKFTPPLFSQSIVIRHVKGYYAIRNGDSLYGYHSSLMTITPDQVFKELKTLLMD
ncbi:lipopolysaccharide heptosyltransferase II [Blochmannia endosymbiont of Camponotus sp. C-003]|uniref:lipopolysaccharide heptosyltransferase II n=1 Tax=unclassified Candidatus Blochmanniella TaxID=711328 RepID=UPI0020255E46|nr:MULTISPECIES: lipopolysaccharide heptosyltransferase II [unclassified Candidatus Blochmannia]URJ23249.1 lipopolysaccharide heptosyltransferase II [Blochmannia endosymbiont of Camponotus sp. C-003]URJ28718.1 lipopolysaccharide heptosyltransferase II [Blochmannia endosymbiont of Camponotus sp. C-046]